MIYVLRTATIAPGKVREAVGWSVEVAGHAARLMGTPVEVLMPIGGNFFDVGWRAQHDSLASMEERLAKMNSDAGYLEMLSKAGDLFVAGSTREQIWRTLA